MKIRALAAILALVGMQIIVGVDTAHAGVAVNLPEPATLSLLGIGAGAVAIGVWWRNRK